MDILSVLILRVGIICSVFYYVFILKSYPPYEKGVLTEMRLILTGYVAIWDHIGILSCGSFNKLGLKDFLALPGIKPVIDRGTGVSFIVILRFTLTSQSDMCTIDCARFELSARRHNKCQDHSSDFTSMIQYGCQRGWKI